MRFRGKVAVVTGASSGIGKATAYAFAKEGAAVVNADIDAERGAAFSETLSRHGYRNLFVATDVAYQDSVDEMADIVFKEFGRIDVLVNNAAVDYTKSNIVDMPYEDMDRILKVNLYGTVHCARAVVPRMREQKQGSIVNVSSLQGLASHLPGTSYQLSKAGIMALTRNLAVEEARHNIRTNCVAPGTISTEGMGAARPEALEPYRRQVPLGRRGRPEEVASVILFLASDEASYANGEIWTVSGGYRANLTPSQLMPHPSAFPAPLMNDPDAQ